MKILLVVNPISGGVDKEPFLRKSETLLNKYGIDHKVFKTTGVNDEHELKIILDEYQPDRVASVGGDGTTLFTAIALLGTDYPMGIIPQGSANGMAIELFVNPDPIEALKDLIMSDTIRGLDLLLVNDQYYTTHLGDVGINANIVDAYSKDKNRGMITYARYFLEELDKLKYFNITVKANGETTRANGLMVSICNSRKYGTGVPLNAVGNPMDGKFEIVIVEKVDTISLIKAGLAKFDEEYLKSQYSQLIVTKNAEIEFEEPRLLQLDGEVIGMFDKIDVKILTGAIKLITHHDNLNIK
ncbi:diacylglycerol kinase family protein [uncultured Eudoraea sp.]|uniref:diacylglycerol/lipid kinase family protein n=1 Tax=uncultured Eudoraea sp. TaxID=1035614 RepID=UPI00261CEB22|nr:diacylglycerol kinase family protein [uncultured Eudoraea sp.]